MNEESLFEEALSRPAVERTVFLEQACAGRPELRAAVAALLAAHEKSGNILDRPGAATLASRPGEVHPDATLDHTPGPENASAAGTATADYGPMSEPGIIIAGRYTLQEKIGEGGMGEVWVARQTEPVKRRVALKLIKVGMDSKAVLARFEQERQALAMMDHPNIAKVLDGGLTPTGQPFFVMELVNGLALNKFCDEARLTTKDRLELFVPICQAVQHAHQKGIVHRDLKPANILVTIIDGKPVPKVIDFGVAKAIAGKLTDESMDTQFGAVVGTLEYMSPEQAGFSGVDIDTRADIYSLGVILYELLTSLRPIDAKRLKNAALTEMIRIIREEEPSKPSTRLSTDDSLPSMAALRQTEPRKLMALLRGELDWVVMKCLEKHRERRYETANGLARDIQRYLADEAVEARPPSAKYRFSKFLHRNRGPVVAAGLVLLALVGGIVGTTYGLIRADRARADEAKQRGIAQANEAKALVAAKAERKARERESEQRAKAEKARDRTRQALDAMTSSVTGDSLTTQKEISEEQKKFLTEVLTYYQEFAGEKADDQASRARTAAAAERVGRMEYRLGRAVQARAAVRLAVDGYSTLAAEFPAVPLYRKNLADSHNNLAILLRSLGKRPEVEEQYRIALAIQDKLVAEFPTVPDYREALGLTHNNLGNLLAGMGKRPEAEDQYRQALAIKEKLVAEFPGVEAHRADLAVSHNNMGVLLAGLGKLPEAEEQNRKALAIREMLAADFPAVPSHRTDLAHSHNNLGLVLKGLGKSPAAEQQYRKALAIQEMLAADFPAVPQYRVHLGGSYCNLGALVSESGQPGESLNWFEKAIRILAAAYEQDRRLVEAREFLRNSRWNRAIAYDRLRKFVEAIADWDEAIELSPEGERPGFRAARATSRLQAGQLAEAEAEVAELTKSSKWNSGQWYDFACFYAVASGKLADKNKEYADQAMDLLRKAVTAGWSDAAHMAKDADLDPLHGREDFKKLIESLAKKSPAKPESKP
jgi:eukaryotic-like serine/threonine-protein kinase